MWKKYGSGAQLQFFHCNSNVMDILSFSHSNLNALVTTNFCTWHDSCAVNKFSHMARQLCCQQIFAHGTAAVLSTNFRTWHIFAHDTKAVLSWHVQKFCSSILAGNGIPVKWNFNEIWIATEKVLVKGFQVHELIGHVTLVAIAGTTSWCPIFKSSHCNSFAETWLHDTSPG